MAGRIRFEPSRRAVLAAGAALLAVRPARAEGALSVFAAASLKPALDEIATLWSGSLSLSYGGSGSLARQVALGAPVDVVILAATDWMDWLEGQRVLDGERVTVARNRLVLAGPSGAAPLDLTAEAIDARLGPEGRMAMGDPLSVPAGRYGQQALETLGLWSDLAPRTLFAEDVRAALAYVARGDVALGLVYGSDLLGSNVAEVAALPAATHQAILYPGAVVAGARPGAEAFLAHVATQADVFARHGFRP